MRRLKGLSARRSFDGPAQGAQSLQLGGVDSALVATSSKRLTDKSMTCRVNLETVEDHIHRNDQVTGACAGSSESQRPGNKEWKGSFEGISVQSSTDSFSSACGSQTSSRPSRASANSSSSSDIYHLPERHPEASERTIVIGFDANARDALVLAMVWVFKNVVKKGETLVLVGTMDFLRGPLGYKVQVNDQTWGANKRFFIEEIARKKLAWSLLPGLKELCEEREIKVSVTIKATARREVAIVEEAVACGAAHVVLDKSLNNRRRKFYYEHLSCDVTRMRRSGGVDGIRSKVSPPSPTSVLTSWPHDFRQQENSAEHRDKPNPGISSHLSPSGLVANVLEKGTSSFTETENSNRPHLNDEDELFTIDHFLARHSVNVDSEGHHLPADQTGYESDDLFSLCGDEPRCDSISTFPPFAQSVLNGAGADIFPPLFNLDSGPPPDKRLPPLPKTAANVSKVQNFVKETIRGLQSVDGLRDMVNVHLCDVLFPGESLLVGASPSNLFLINSQCTTRDDSGLLVPYSMTAGPPTAYVAVQGGAASKLSELRSGHSVMVMDTSGRARSVPVGYTTTQPIKGVMRLETSGEDRDRVHSILVLHKQSVCFINFSTKSDVSVVDLKTGDAIAMCLRS